MTMNTPHPDRTASVFDSNRQRFTLNAGQLVLFFALAIALAFFAGVMFAELTDSPHDNDDFETFWQTWDILERDYYFDMPENSTLIQGAAQGLLATTGDPYTYLAPPDRAELDRQQTDGEFGGIGADIALLPDGRYRITTIYPDLPAARSGLQTGDIVQEIDGKLSTDMDQNAFLSAIRGDVGTTVRLTILRPTTDETMIVNIERARIQLPTAFSDRFGEIGYVRLIIFNANAAAALETEVQTLLDDGVTGLILDLRQNPGGLLDQAVEIADLFLDAGIIVKQRSSDSDETIYESENGDIAESIPMVVLVDEHSASASEVVAGALRDRDRAILIGNITYGKGSVQHIYDLEDGSQLHVTVSLWLTPDDSQIQGNGLAPDIAIDPASATLDNVDPYIQAGLDYFQRQTDAEAE